MREWHMRSLLIPGRKKKISIKMALLYLSIIYVMIQSYGDRGNPEKSAALRVPCWVLN